MVTCLGSSVPSDSILPSDRLCQILPPTLSELDAFDVDGYFPASHKSVLLLSVVMVEEDELLGIEEHWILEAEPFFLLEGSVVVLNALQLVGLFLLVVALEAVLPDLGDSHMIIIPPEEVPVWADSAISK